MDSIFGVTDRVVLQEAEARHDSDIHQSAVAAKVLLDVNPSSIGGDATWDGERGMRRRGLAGQKRIGH
jgi:hypothetical protein